MRFTLLFAANIAAGLLTWSTTVVLAGCASPAPGLNTGQPNVDVETTNFNYGGDAFPLDIYSGYAPLNSSQNGTFCIRYEVENTAAKPIQLLYWPLASGLQIESLPPHKRPSIAVTTPPGGPPIVGGTIVYAFLSDVARTFAYQQNKQYPFLVPRPPSVPKYDFGDTATTVLASNSSHPPLHFAQVDHFQSYDLKEPRKFPVIGSQFSEGELEVSANSFAEWDGKVYTINIAIKRSNETAKNLQAPFAYALAKGGPDYVFSTYRALKKDGGSLPLTNNAFASTIRSEPSRSYLYVIQQPITFLGPDGHVCFLAAVYSPVPIPQNLLSCSLTSM